MSTGKLKEAGGTAAGILLFLAFLALPILLLSGAAKFSLWALDWIPGTIGFSILACLIVVPLAIIPSTRGFAAVLFGIASFIFVVCLWLYAFAFTYLEWGMMGVIIGVLVAGIGVVLTAILAAIFSGTWFVLGNIAFIFGLFGVARLLGAWMEHLVESRRLRIVAREAPGSVTLIQGSDL